MSDKAKNTGKTRATNEKPVSLNPIGFEDALRGLLTIPPSQEPKDEERKQRKATNKKKPDAK